MPPHPRSMLTFSEVATRVGATEAELIELAQEMVLRDTRLDEEGWHLSADAAGWLAADGLTQARRNLQQRKGRAA